MDKLEGFLSPVQTLSGELSPEQSLEGDITIPHRIDRVKFSGVTITPSDQTQTLGTNDKWVDGDIVINPIPSNYGRIIWNGSFMRIV